MASRKIRLRVPFPFVAYRLGGDDMEFFETDFGAWLGIVALASLLISAFKTMHDFLNRK